MTKQYAVLGHPISQSKSPQIHQAAYSVLGLDWSYGRFDVSPGQLEVFLATHPEISGFSVTMPLKEEACSLAQTRSEDVTVTGAANTLVRTDSGWEAHNTDIFGLVMSLSALRARLGKVLILGTGATAKSAIMAIRQLSSSADVMIYGRNRGRVTETVIFARNLGLNARSARSLVASSATADLTISVIPQSGAGNYATSLLRWPFWKPRGVLFDTAYNPWPSKLASSWSSRGGEVLRGSAMLTWQAIAQIRIFTTGNSDQELPNEVAVHAAMENAASEVD